jgi:hypothetical protein
MRFLCLSHSGVRQESAWNIAFITSKAVHGCTVVDVELAGISFSERTIKVQVELRLHLIGGASYPITLQGAVMANLRLGEQTLS